MSRVLLLLPALALSACVGTAPDTPPVAAPAAPGIEDVAAAMNASAGTAFTEDLTFAGASVVEGRLLMRMAHGDAASEFTEGERSDYARRFDTDFAASLCAAEATRTLIESSGGVAVRVTSSDGQPLAQGTIDSC